MSTLWAVSNWILISKYQAIMYHGLIHSCSDILYVNTHTHKVSDLWLQLRKAAQELKVVVFLIGDEL